MAPEDRTPRCAAHLLKLAGAEAQIKGGLFGRKEGTPFLRPRGPCNIVFHPCNIVFHRHLAASERRPAALPCSGWCPNPVREQRPEKPATRKSSPRVPDHVPASCAREQNEDLPRSWQIDSVGGPESGQHLQRCEGPSISVSMADWVFQARRAGARYFPEEPFAESAWNMVLDLLHCDLRGRRLSISGLALGASVPGTTALR